MWSGIDAACEHTLSTGETRRKQVIGMGITVIILLNNILIIFHISKSDCWDNGTPSEPKFRFSC